LSKICLRKNHRLKYYLIGFFLALITVLFFRVIPVASSSDARELYLAFKICEGEAEFLFPNRLGFPSSKPPFYHWLLCASSKLTNSSNFALLGRLVNFSSVLVIFYSLWLLFGARALAASLAMMFTYVFWDELISTKVDFVTCALIVLAVSFFVGKRYLLGVFVSVLSVFAKSLFPLFFVAVFSLALISEFTHGLVVSGLIGSVAIFWIIFTYSANIDFFKVWVVFEIFSRGLGDVYINPSPWYFYAQKFLVNFFPVSFVSLVAAFNFQKLTWHGKRLILASAFVLFCLSFMEGKRTNYILPLLPFLAAALATNLKICFRPVRIIAKSAEVLFISISCLIFVVLLKPDVRNPLTILFVFTFDNLPIFLGSFLTLSLISNRKPLLRAAFTFSFFWIILVSYQNVLKHHRKFDLRIFNLIHRECTEVILLKEHRNEAFDLLIFNLKDKIKNNLVNSDNKYCILADNPQEKTDNHCLVLEKRSNLTLLKCFKV